MYQTAGKEKSKGNSDNERESDDFAENEEQNFEEDSKIKASMSESVSYRKQSPKFVLEGFDLNRNNDFKSISKEQQC